MVESAALEMRYTSNGIQGSNPCLSAFNINYMSHEIEADYKEDWDNENSFCENCTSYQADGNTGFCTEAQAMVPFNAHCDFFQSID